MTTQKQIRAAFWAAHPNLPRDKWRWIGDKEWFYQTDTRCAFVDFIDYLHREGQISDALANRATL
jgi:hypothetical protein